MNNQGISQRTFEALEWQKILELVAAGCQTVPGHRRVLSLLPAPTFLQAQRWLEETSSCMNLHQQEITLPISTLEDLDPLLNRLGAEGVLEPVELLQLLGLLDVSKETLK